MIPNTDLYFGLQAVGSDQVMLVLLKYVDKYKELDFYSEHGITNLKTYLMSPQASKVRIEELPDQSLTKPANLGRKKKLSLEWVEKGSNTCLGQGVVQVKAMVWV